MNDILGGGSLEWADASGSTANAVGLLKDIATLTHGLKLATAFDEYITPIDLTQASSVQIPNSIIVNLENPYNAIIYNILEGQCNVYFTGGGPTNVFTELDNTWSFQFSASNPECLMFPTRYDPFITIYLPTLCTGKLYVAWLRG